MEASELVVGIDLGTTNSLIGTVIKGELQLFKDATGAEMMPSVVGMDGAGAILVGRSARNRRLIDPQGTAVSVKRLMGMDCPVNVGDQRLSPSQVSALILAALLDRVEQATGVRPGRAVITVPAYFNDAQREATRLAGELAGLKVERLVNEPTAAALCYQTGGEAQVLVYDFGGGTFDVSVLDRDEGFLEVRSSHGDTHLGGDDVDAALLERVLTRLGPARARVEGDPRAMTRLAEAVERAKIALSSREEVQLIEPFLVGEGDLAVHLHQRLGQSDVEAAAGPLIDRTLTCIDQALKDAAVAPTDLDRVILVGGSSRIPSVARRVSAHLGRPVLLDEKVDKAVALGAALLAGRAAGQAVEEVLVDITPHTLACGVVAEDLNTNYTGDLISLPVIPRNTVVPTERERLLATRVDDQPAVEIPVVQGEAPRVKENTWLGRLVISDLPPSPARSPVKITFRLDLSGVLKVNAVHLPSGRAATVTFADSPYHLTAQRRQSQQGEIEGLRRILPERRGLPAAERALGEAMIARAKRALTPTPVAHGEAVRNIQALVAALTEALAAGSECVPELSDQLSDWLLELA